MGEGKPASSASDLQIFAAGSISLKSFIFFFSRKSNLEFEVKEYKYRILFNVKNKLLKICSNIIKVLLRKYITGDCMTTDQV